MGSPLSKTKREEGELGLCLSCMHLSVFILETDLSYLGMKYPEINSGV